MKSILLLFFWSIKTCPSHNPSLAPPHTTDALLMHGDYGYCGDCYDWDGWSWRQAGWSRVPLYLLSLCTLLMLAYSICLWILMSITDIGGITTAKSEANVTLSLSLTNINRTHEGIYKCELGGRQASYIITVEGKWSWHVKDVHMLFWFAVRQSIGWTTDIVSNTSWDKLVEKQHQVQII